MSDTPVEEKKVEHINLKVVGPDGGEVAFKIKKTTNLSKLMEAYATKTGQVSFCLIVRELLMFDFCMKERD
jgi:hypothetical protein